MPTDDKKRTRRRSVQKTEPALLQEALQESLQAAANIGREREDPRAEALDDRDGGRQLLGGHTLSLKLTHELPKDVVPRWFVDQKDRIRNALQAGYVPVVSDDTVGYKVDVPENLAGQDQWISRVTGKGTGGAPEISYLMVIKREFYEYDQKRKQNDIDELDEAIRGNTLNPNDGLVYHKATIEHGGFRR